MAYRIHNIHLTEQDLRASRRETMRSLGTRLGRMREGEPVRVVLTRENRDIDYRTDSCLVIRQRDDNYCVVFRDDYCIPLTSVIAASYVLTRLETVDGDTEGKGCHD